jgi:hypothetical protein
MGAVWHRPLKLVVPVVSIAAGLFIERAAAAATSTGSRGSIELMTATAATLKKL